MGEMGWFKWCKLFMSVNTRRQEEEEEGLGAGGGGGMTPGGGGLNKRLKKRRRRRRRAELACRDRPSRVHHMNTMVLYNTTCTRYANHTLFAHFLHTASHAPHTLSTHKLLLNL